MLRVELEGSNRAYHARYSSSSIMELARKLIQAGYPDQPFECFRDDVKCLTFKSLAWAAEHTIREEPFLKIIKYKAFPSSRLQKLKHGITGDAHSIIRDTVTPKIRAEHPLTVSSEAL